MKKVTHLLPQEVYDGTRRVRQSVPRQTFSLLASFLCACTIAGVVVPGTAFAHINQGLSQKRKTVQTITIGDWSKCFTDAVAPQASTASSTSNSQDTTQDSQVNLEQPEQSQDQVPQDLSKAALAVIKALALNPLKYSPYILVVIAALCTLSGKSSTKTTCNATTSDTIASLCDDFYTSTPGNVDDGTSFDDQSDQIDSSTGVISQQNWSNDA